MKKAMEIGNLNHFYEGIPVDPMFPHHRTLGDGIGELMTEALNPKTTMERLTTIRETALDQVWMMRKGSSYGDGYEALISQCDKRIAAGTL